MGTTLDLVYQYRYLIGKCESGRGLEVEEIEQLIDLEAFFGVHDRRGNSDLWECRRQYHRERVDLPATLRGDKLADRVTVIDLGPGGLVCTDVPYVEVGTTLEIVFEDLELRQSHRFRAVVAWRRDQDEEDYVVGLELIGTPLLVRYGPPSAPVQRPVESDDVTTAKLDRVAA
ncbi:MAG TPA: PilZ domain-containing protein [Kofleriaceae bacterium]|nr:PilZ domain-containing protein [Kofleriaceae bacterium]